MRGCGCCLTCRLLVVRGRCSNDKDHSVPSAPVLMQAARRLVCRGARHVALACAAGAEETGRCGPHCNWTELRRDGALAAASSAAQPSPWRLLLRHRRPLPRQGRRWPGAGGSCCLVVAKATATLGCSWQSGKLCSVRALRRAGGTKAAPRQGIELGKRSCDWSPVKGVPAQGRTQLAVRAELHGTATLRGTESWWQRHT